jgi:hypothetical protein
MTSRLVLSLCMLGSAALLAQEDPFPVMRPSVPMGRRAPQPRAPRPEPTGEQTAPPSEVRESAPQAPNLDKHYLQKDEYLITEEAYKSGSGWSHVFVAKMVTPPTAESKQEGEFFIIGGHKKGEKIWTKHYQLTHPATQEELKLGTNCYVLDANRENDIYIGPKDREDNLSHPWFVGTLNDDSNLYKGYLTVAGYKIKPGAIRVVNKK